VAGLFGCALYFVMPGIGPQIAFDLVYPGGLPDPTAVPLALYPTSAVAPRNAMPSLHTTWALLIAIGAWRLGPVPRSVAVVNLIGTVVATLGLREHYVVDLVVAIPFTLGVHGFVSLYDDAAGGRDRAAAAAIGGTLLTAAWLLTIRYGAGPLRSTPWVVSVLVLATMIVSGWLFCRLERGAERAAARFSASTSRLSS
jgi:hypothetical protein